MICRHQVFGVLRGGDIAGGHVDVATVANVVLEGVCSAWQNQRPPVSLNERVNVGILSAVKARCWG